MKKLFIAFFISFIFIKANAQWMHQSSGTSADLWSVYFTDSNTGYVAGDSGIIMKTIDGGTTWSRQISGTSTALKSVRFIDSSKGIIAGSKGVILKTINGGASWSEQNSGTSADLWSVFFVDTLTGYAVGDSGVILKTSNEGISWNRQNSGFMYGLKSVYFTDITTGFAVGIIGKILKTNDGGESWKDCSSDFTSYHFYSVSFTDSLTGYVGGFDLSQSLPANYHPAILKTINGGKEWVDITINFYINFVRSLFFMNANTGYAAGGVGGGGFPSCDILKTTNGGTSWNKYSIDSCWVGIQSVFFPDSLTGYAVGQRGTILKTTASVQSFNDEVLTQSTGFSLYPNPADDMITIETSGITGECFLSVISLTGQVFIQKKLTENTNQVDINLLPAGAYIIKLTDNYTTTVKILLKLHQF